MTYDIKYIPMKNLEDYYLRTDNWKFPRSIDFSANSKDSGRDDGQLMFQISLPLLRAIENKLPFYASLGFYHEEYAIKYANNVLTAFDNKQKWVEKFDSKFNLGFKPAQPPPGFIDLIKLVKSNSIYIELMKKLQHDMTLKEFLLLIEDTKWACMDNMVQKSNFSNSIDNKLTLKLSEDQGASVKNQTMEMLLLILLHVQDAMLNEICHNNGINFRDALLLAQGGNHREGLDWMKYDKNLSDLRGK